MKDIVDMEELDEISMIEFENFSLEGNFDFFFGGGGDIKIDIYIF